jgi:hypothetical protein
MESMKIQKKNGGVVAWKVAPFGFLMFPIGSNVHKADTFRFHGILVFSVDTPSTGVEGVSTEILRFRRKSDTLVSGHGSRCVYDGGDSRWCGCGSEQFDNSLFV